MLNTFKQKMSLALFTIAIYDCIKSNEIIDETKKLVI